MSYYLALVSADDDTFDPAFARHDKYQRSFKVVHAEGDFAALQCVIERPELALLDPESETYAWLSMDDGEDLRPLFFGRIIALPTNPQADFVTVEFLAKPVDYGTAKETVAATLRELPFFDYAFIDPQAWTDPDAVLEARTDVWHIDRVTHEVTISSIIEGEDGTLNVPASNIPFDGISISYGENPVKRVKLSLRAMWTQQVGGFIDATPAILAAFGGQVTSYTGQGLYNGWPKTGDSLGGVYTFGTQTIKVADGKHVKKQRTTVRIEPQDGTTDQTSFNFNFGVAVGGGSAYTLTYAIPGVTDAINTVMAEFRLWAFDIFSIINFAYEVPITEDVNVLVTSDVQEMVHDDEETAAETIEISSGQITSPVGPPGGPLEIPCDKTDGGYFATARGRQSFEYGLANARALLMRRARAVSITAKVPFTKAIDATLRKSATFHHDAIPGGEATGKITSVTFGVDGDTGEEFGSITIACMVGKNTTFATDDGIPVYGSADYMGPDYQIFVGAVKSGLGGKVFYNPPGSDNAVAVGGATSPNISSVEVTGTANEQRDALQGGEPFPDINSACDAVNSIYTKVTLTMAEVEIEPLQRTFTPAVVNIPVPTGVNLGGL